MLLHTITTITEDLNQLILDDPVRPEIPVADRVNANSRIYMLKSGDQTQAVTCVKFLSVIPAAVEDMVTLWRAPPLLCSTPSGVIPPVLAAA